jgi:PLAT/LH2 domain/Glycerophosphoryl diester phosphodiesterase family
MPPLALPLPCPFYIFGHNPNTTQAVVAALDAGANAIEPDVNVYAARPNELCVAEASLLGGGAKSSAPPLDRYLTDLAAIARKRPELALVVFDCKRKAATPRLGARLLEAIRTHLTGTGLTVILSVATRRRAALFTDIALGLGEREGAMLDSENDPASVSYFLQAAGVQQPCFGNGISFLNPLLGPNVRPSLESATRLRAGRGQLCFTYAWTVNSPRLMREYMRIGVDGLITDHPARLRALMEEPEFQPLVRPATRADNPLAAPPAAYGLIVHTGERCFAGTDARVTFTLTGDSGSADVTIDGRYSRRFGRDAWNHIALPAPNLGALHTLTVQQDRHGVAPGWFLERVLVESARYGVLQEARCEGWVGTAPVTLHLEPR